MIKRDLLLTQPKNSKRLGRNLNMTNSQLIEIIELRHQMMIKNGLVSTLKD